MSKFFLLAFGLDCLLTVPLLAADPAEKHNVHPPAGYVSTEAAAIRIAVAVWEPIYGRKIIADEKPYHARLAAGVWTVEGSLPPGSRLGGVAVAEIRKRDGQVLRVSHGK